MLIRPIAILLALALTAAIVWAFMTASFSASFGWMIRDPWGIVSLLDLYIGFVITSVLVFVIEKGRPIAWAVILPTFFLGNVVTAFWLAWRAPMLLDAASGLARRGA
jgi:hypothetical protein